MRETEQQRVQHHLDFRQIGRTNPEIRQTTRVSFRDLGIVTKSLGRIMPPKNARLYLLARINDRKDVPGNKLL
ncbi:hypothetical protein NY2A_b189L [Paramecium bursaria Chlorella virus NY2A]|uniref:Uncharacterized protein b189L n=1 Tax=Paramecium bursaria Chlorella virus NY2A TaxID=46021 RepID=A7IW64_PBCVN|nr:hypothetical protein NY2A_b189L [Paramecium bursaria Chlorella virus NY2A]ABT14588.1 hypothetical protein NY2A_b189L [Paramecium bursaria Chlorella virus NY2A]